MTSFRGVLASPGFLATWALLGIPAAGATFHNLALAATPATALVESAWAILGLCAHAWIFGAIRLLGRPEPKRPASAQTVPDALFAGEVAPGRPDQS